MTETRSRLSEPFEDHEIEWRVMRCGQKNGKVWAQLVAYIDARAIMNRLDNAVGPECWQTAFREIQTPNGAGILCTLSLRFDENWVAKEDGADFSRGIEITKSGVSDSLKRAAVQWGIGRYLYTLPTIWADNIQDGYPPGGSDGILIVSKEHDIKAWCPRPSLSEPKKTPPQQDDTKPTDEDNPFDEGRAESYTPGPPAGGSPDFERTMASKYDNGKCGFCGKSHIEKGSVIGLLNGKWGLPECAHLA